MVRIGVLYWSDASICMFYVQGITRLVQMQNFSRLIFFNSSFHDLSFLNCSGVSLWSRSRKRIKVKTHILVHHGTPSACIHRAPGAIVKRFLKKSGCKFWKSGLNFGGFYLEGYSFLWDVLTVWQALYRLLCCHQATIYLSVLTLG